MQWIFVGILIAFGIWIGGLLIGVLGAIWPYLLGGTVLIFGLMFISLGFEIFLEKAQEWKLVKFLSRNKKKIWWIYWVLLGGLLIGYYFLVPYLYHQYGSE